MKNERPYCVAKHCDTQHCKTLKDFKCPKADEFLTRCTQCNDVFEFNGSYLCPKCRGVV